MQTFNCFKCNGTGEVSFRHIANGVCFQCNGTGKLSGKAVGVQFTPVAPIVPEAFRSTAKQWDYLARLAGDSDTKCRTWLKAAGAPVASQVYVDRATMSRAIEIAKGGV